MDVQTQVMIFMLLGLVTMVCLTVCVILFFVVHSRKVVEKEAKLQLIEKEAKLQLVENEAKMQLMEKEAQLAIFKSASEAEEKQREKIGKNLHDGVVPKLSMIARSFGANIKDIGTVDFNYGNLQRDHKLISEVIDEIRGVTHDLVPKTLLILGIVEALKELTTLAGGMEGVETAFENAAQLPEEFPFTMDEQLTIYRMCQELLNNLAKHSTFTFLKLMLKTEEDKLEISIMHNGKGVTNEEIADYASKGSGLGLKSLNSRAMILKARIDYSVLPEFSIITITLPLVR